MLMPRVSGRSSFSEFARLFIASVANFVPNSEFDTSSHIYENTRYRRYGGNMMICLILINELTFVRNCDEIQIAPNTKLFRAKNINANSGWFYLINAVGDSRENILSRWLMKKINYILI